MEEIEMEELRTRVVTALKERNAKEVREIFDTIPNIDIADAISEVDDLQELMFIFRVVPKDYSGAFFAELPVEQQEIIIKAFSDKELIALLEESFADDIVDTIEEMPANIVNRILRVAPADLRKDINQLLNYKDNTAGSVMTTEYIEMRENVTVKDALKFIRQKGRDAETVYTVFVRDAKRTLVGTINLDDLIFSKDEQELEEVMDKDFVTCNVNDDQEEVANMFKRYDLNAMAVVNDENKIIGIITIDDVVDIIVEEANEDMAALNQVSKMEDPYLKTPVIKLVWKCIPWLAVLMILQIGSEFINTAFNSYIKAFGFLAVFSPLILDAGGNSGGQTTTMIVRSLAMDEFEKGDFKRVVWKELRVAGLIALIVGTFAFALTFFEMSVLKIGGSDTALAGISNPHLSHLIIAALVGVSLMVTMIVSRLIGCMLPFFAKKIHIDPAVFCGPFTTTIVDVVSLLTYYCVWIYVLAPIFGVTI
ncbi:MAG: magnesium transporter [Bacilli bacterium]|nr:magnesium transporter [Bacilli bacterium]